MGGVAEFYAVTTTSLYRVFVNPLLESEAIAMKIAVRDQSAVKLNEMLSNGNLIGITRLGLIAYRDHKSPRRRCEDVNTRYWGGRTSPVVALFFDQEQARRCLDEADVQPADPRWRGSTLQVLDAIGDDHPCFVLSDMEELRFPTD